MLKVFLQMGNVAISPHLRIRFSSTLSSPNTTRSCGQNVIPNELISSGFLPTKSICLNRHCPELIADNQKQMEKRAFPNAIPSQTKST